MPWEGREGWTVEHPGTSLSEAEFRRVMREQTPCVEVVTRRVDTGAVPEGFIVGPISGRSWVSFLGSLDLLVESGPGPGVVECGEGIEAPRPGIVTEVLSCPSATGPPR